MSDRRQWTKEEDSFLIENYPLLGTKRCSEKIGRSEKAVYCHIKKLRDRGIPIGHTKFRNDYSKEEEQFIIDNYSVLGQKRTLEELNKRFGGNRSIGGIEHKAKTLSKKLGKNIQVSMDNKGKHISEAKSKFEVGTIISMRTNHGTEKYIKLLDSESGETYWMLLKRHLIGEESKGKVVIFLDNDKNNCSIDNLACISRASHCKMKNYHFYSDNPEITKAGIACCELEELLEKQNINTNEEDED